MDHMTGYTFNSSLHTSVLFTIYTSTLFEIVERHLPSVHCYADDNQLYVAFSPNVSDEDVVALNATRDCIRDLQDWLVRNRLKLNDDKTEFLLIGTRQQLMKVNSSRITVGNEAIEVLGKLSSSQAIGKA